MQRTVSRGAGLPVIDQLAMTLLEAVIALTILVLSVTGLLEGLQSAARLERSAVSWSTAAAIAESASQAAETVLPDDSLPDGYHRSVEIRPWRGGVSDVVVTVTTPEQRQFVLHRLVRDARRAD